MMMELYLKHKNADEPVVSNNFLLDERKTKEVFADVTADIIAEWFVNS